MEVGKQGSNQNMDCAVAQKTCHLTQGKPMWNPPYDVELYLPSSPASMTSGSGWWESCSSSIQRVPCWLTLTWLLNPWCLAAEWVNWLGWTCHVWSNVDLTMRITSWASMFKLVQYHSLFIFDHSYLEYHTFLFLCAVFFILICFLWPADVGIFSFSFCKII